MKPVWLFLFFCPIYKVCICASCFCLLAVEEVGAVTGWLRNRLGSGLPFCTGCRGSACHRACLRAKCHRWLWLSGQHRPGLPEGSWQVPPCGVGLVLPWCSRTACSFTAALCRHDGSFLGSSSGIHRDFEALCLGVSSVDFSVPARLRAVTVGASIQGPWFAALTVTVKLLCLQMLPGRPLRSPV